MMEISNDLFTLEMQILYQNSPDFIKLRMEKTIKRYYPLPRARKIIDKLKDTFNTKP